MKNQYYNNVNFTVINSIKSQAGALGSKVDLNGFYSRYMSQKREYMGRIITKEKQFLIQPQPTGYRCNLDGLKEFSQVCFVDIDCKDKITHNTDLEGIGKKIINNAKELMKDSPVIFIQESISGGIHVIAYMDKKADSIDDYKAKSRLLTAYFTAKVESITGEDLTSVKGVLDTHNISPVQLFYVSTTDMMVNTDFAPHVFSEKEEAQLKEKYPSIFEEEKTKEGKNKDEKTYDYKPIDIESGIRYRIFRKKAVFDHLGDSERYKLATSLKVLVSTKSLDKMSARKIYEDVMRKNSVVNEDLNGMMRKFDEVMARKDIKPLISYSLLKTIGISIIEC